MTNNEIKVLINLPKQLKQFTIEHLLSQKFIVFQDSLLNKKGFQTNLAYHLVNKTVNIDLI